MNQFILDIESKINASPIKPIHRGELICISYLVFFSGIKMSEMGRLEVRDVVDHNGRALDFVKKYEKQLWLNYEAKNAIEKYYTEMKRQRPTQALRRKSLFPTYHNQRTLRRHWKIVNTGYNEIRRAGIKNHFLAEQSNFPSLGKLYIKGSEQYRLSTRQYYAIVHDKQIRSGTQMNDERCIRKLLSLFEQAERIQSGNPTAKKDAKKILNEAQEYVSRIKSNGLRDSHSDIIPLIKSQLSQFLQN